MNLTVTIDDEVLRRARIRALEHGTSVNALVRDFLVSYAGADQERNARQRIVELARSSNASSGGHGRRWSREELYEERLSRRDQSATQS
jgi:plasmid stability protein